MPSDIMVVADKNCGCGMRVGAGAGRGRGAAISEVAGDSTLTRRVDLRLGVE